MTGSGPAVPARALARIPGGVNSPVRAFGAVGGDPFFVARGEGAFLIDTDGRRLLDYVQSWGASILGHAHPAVVEAVQRAAAGGTSFGAPTAARGRAGRGDLRRRAVGREGAARVVGHRGRDDRGPPRRGATGRSKILKFAGCYHGHLDALLVAAGSGVATLGIPGSAGVTEGAVADTIVVPYNDDAALDAGVRRSTARDLAAVLVEPVAANMGLVPPVPGFLERLRGRCIAHDTLLVFDEVITGLPAGPRRRAGPLRHHPRPVDLRQGRRRRAPARRGRWTGVADGRARAARSGVPGRHPQREPARDRGRPRRARRARRRVLRRRSSAPRPASPTG